MKYIKEENKDFRYIVLWFMVSVYPLIVIPNPINHNGAPRYIVLGILSLTALYSLIRERSKVDFKHPSFIPLGIFLFFGLISTILAPHPITAWFGLDVYSGISRRFTGYTTYIFCSILFFISSQTDKKEKILKWSIITAALVSTIGILQHYGLNLVPSSINFSGSYSTIGNPNFFGTYVVFILPGVILKYIFNPNRLWLISTALIYGGLLVSVTRGVWLTFFLVFLMISYYSLIIIKRKKLLMTMVLTMMLVTLVLAPAKNGIIIRRAFSISDQVSMAVQMEDDAGSSRFYIWKESIKLLPEHWAFGMGPDHLVYANIVPKENIADKVHNIYLEIAVTMGVFALISFLSFFAVLLSPRKLSKSNDLGFILFIMVLSYLIQGFFNIDVVMVMPIFWIVLGLMVSNDRSLDSSYKTP